MIKYIVMALLLVPLAAKSQINQEEQSVQIIGYWDKKEKHTYDFVSEKAEVKGKDTIIKESYSYKVDITVLDSTATSYTVLWKCHDVRVTKGNKTLEKIVGLNEGLEIKFETDEMGAFNKLLNLKEIKQHNEKALKLTKQESDATIRQSLEAVIKEKYTSPEAIQAHSLKEVALFYTFHGIALNLDEPIETDFAEENPLTKDTIKSHITIELDEIDNEDATYIVKYWQKYDKEAILPMVKELIKDFMGKHANDINEYIKEADLSDYYGAQMHESGWPVYVYFERTIEINKGHSLETRSFTLLE